MKVHFDGIKNGKLIGWAIRKNDVPLTFEFSDGNKYETDAVIERKGLTLKDMHETGKCGFEISLPVLKWLRGEQPSVNITAQHENTVVFKQASYRPIFFMHIAKTAGTSVNDAFASILNTEDYRFHLEGVNDWSPEKLDHIKTKLFFISGHLNYLRINDIIGLKDHFKITIIREPINQLLSHINWIYSIAEDTNSNFYNNHQSHIKSLSLMIRKTDWTVLTQVIDLFENMSDEQYKLFNNCQTRYLITKQNSRTLELSDIHEALDNISQFDVVLDNSNLNELPILLNKEYPLLNITIGHSNTNKSKSITILENSDISEYLQQHIMIDNILYNFIQHNKNN